MCDKCDHTEIKFSGKEVLYQHYKGGIYGLLGVALGQDTRSESENIENQEFVVYKSIDKRGKYTLFIRSKAEFFGDIESGKPRFKKL